MAKGPNYEQNPTYCHPLPSYFPRDSSYTKGLSGVVLSWEHHHGSNVVRGFANCRNPATPTIRHTLQFNMGIAHPEDFANVTVKGCGSGECPFFTTHQLPSQERLEIACDFTTWLTDCGEKPRLNRMLTVIIPALRGDEGDKDLRKVQSSPARATFTDHNKRHVQSSPAACTKQKRRRSSGDDDDTVGRAPKRVARSEDIIEISDSEAESPAGKGKAKACPSMKPVAGPSYLGFSDEKVNELIAACKELGQAAANVFIRNDLKDALLELRDDLEIL
ncbi:hypothetical protein BT96DRAFT_1098359 [Gymnopus androsaceus JB14]|uniref:Uncharacterized protein n=1 Tax=Gymnopus androsaceus JB14 TaxID=1447944 RepID=A0A6A4GGC0_9AGAR|nr:hypothetical protein BT96DRAFT_1098359 [Gymnopus androsaceus JB14]